MHRVPDALSRLNETDLEEDEVASFEEIADPWYIKRIEEIQERPLKYRSWKIEDGMIYKQRLDPMLGPITGEEDSWKLVVPTEHRGRLLEDAHREETAGHLGVEKTYERVAQEYYCSEVWHDVYQFVQNYDNCQRYKPDQTAPKGLMDGRVIERP